MMDNATRFIDHDLIERIEKFIAARPGMTASAFGTQSINDPALVTDLREGRELRRKTRIKIEEFMTTKAKRTKNIRAANGVAA